MVQFDKQTREDLIVTAIEGGSNYWYSFRKKAIEIVDEYSKIKDSFSVRVLDAIYNGAIIPIHDVETDDFLGNISIESIDNAEKILFQNYFYHYADIRQEEYDVDAADVWFQLSVMEEVVYG